MRKSACPVCGEAPRQAYRPFCSGRCADIDLQRWLDGEYAIPDGPRGDRGDDGEENDKRV